MKQTIAIVQARLNSTRLPNKVLKKIGPKTILEIIVERISLSKHVEQIIIATSTSPTDDKLADFVTTRLPCPLVRGSLANVLERFYQASCQYPSQYIVRITADDPFKEAQLIDRCVEVLLQDASIDYCSNTLSPTYPEGLDVEVFKTAALKTAYTQATLDSEKEHVTPYIWKNNQLFHLQNISHCEDLSSWRWTVDKPQDFELAKRIYQHFNYNYQVPYQDIISWCKQNPEILTLNNDTVRNEGYLKSIRGEKL